MKCGGGSAVTRQAASGEATEEHDHLEGPDRSPDHAPREDQLPLVLLKDGSKDPTELSRIESAEVVLELPTDPAGLVCEGLELPAL